MLHVGNSIDGLIIADACHSMTRTEKKCFIVTWNGENGNSFWWRWHAVMLNVNVAVVVVAAVGQDNIYVHFQMSLWLVCVLKSFVDQHLKYRKHETKVRT